MQSNYNVRRNLQSCVCRYSWPRLAFAVPEIVLSSLLSIVVENLAVCTMWFGDWYDFYIVEKEVEEEVVPAAAADNVDVRKKLVQTV